MNFSKDQLAEISDFGMTFKSVHTGNIPCQRQLAWIDLKEGFQKWQIWLTLAHQDIKIRYRRSVLGPFWLTISMAITLYSMGYLYSHLFHVQLEAYYPYLVAGMLGWTLISTLMSEYTDGLVSYQSLIRQIKLPYTLHIHRIAARNILIFFHNILVLLPIYYIFHNDAQINWCSLLLIPGLILIYINALSFGMILAIIGARYRDMSQLIKSLIQIIFFVTPVIWKPTMLGERAHLFIALNPFYAMLEFIRKPLLGQLPNLASLVVAIFVTIIGFVLASFLFIRCRKRIIYWL